MKKTYIAILTAAAGLCSCIEMMDSASQADVVNPLNVSFKVKAVTGFVDADGNGTINTDFPVDGLTVRFTNFEEDAVIETLTDENGIAQTEVAPGNYTISVFGESESEGNTYYLNGSVQNKAITKDITPEQAEASNDFSIAIRPAMVGPLCFSQIFYCGSTNPETQATYFRDQFYEIYNNGDETYYLDHLCFARLVPEFATATLPEWPAEDGLNNYVYAVTVWQLPGNGTDYPLKPGESFIITQEAANHADHSKYGGLIDTSLSEFETWAGNPQRVNPDVPDLEVRFLVGIHRDHAVAEHRQRSGTLHLPARQAPRIPDHQYGRGGRDDTETGGQNAGVRPHSGRTADRRRGDAPDIEQPQHEAYSRIRGRRSGFDGEKFTSARACAAK